MLGIQRCVIPTLQELTVRWGRQSCEQPLQPHENAAMASVLEEHLSLSVEIMRGFTKEETSELSFEGCLEVQ